MSTTTTLHLATIDDARIHSADAEQRADDAAFERRYKRWSLRRRIALPDEQLKTICAIFFNLGIRQGAELREVEIARLTEHVANLEHDLATETTEDDGLSERERLTRGGYWK